MEEDKIEVDFNGVRTEAIMSLGAPSSEALVIRLRRGDQYLIGIKLLVVWTGDRIQLIQEERG